jgi:elongation factor 2
MFAIKEAMRNTQNVRNISVIAHVDHGKSTLVDSLLAKGGLIKKSRAGMQVGMDTEQQEIDRGITIKSCGVSLIFERRQNDEKEEAAQVLINLIDSPGHVDFSSEVTAALRVTDGAIVVVDCIEGVMVQTETVLRQAVQERIRPVLFLNKLDRQFLEVHASLDDMYSAFQRTVESVNVVCQTYKDSALEDIEITPQLGMVGFGSGLHCWGFTLTDFAEIYSNKFALSTASMMRKLWGENFWDPQLRKWAKKKQNSNGDRLQRGFCEFVLKPIQVLMDSIMNDEKEIFEPIIKCLGLKFSKQELDECHRSKDFLKLVMRTWLPAADTLVDMICDHLPSPVEAQKYRIPLLYTGALDTEEAQQMMNCDPSGHLSMYVSKMVPQKGNTGQFIAFGRVFSGSVKPGQEIRIMGANYEHGSNKDFVLRKVQRVLCMMPGSSMPINECSAGNICGLVGIDKYLVKSGTLSTSPNVFPFKTMKFSVAAVVQVAVEPTKPGDLQKLVLGLKRLAQYDPLIKISTNKQGEHIVAGAGELHLECSLKTLQTDYMNNAEIRVSNPITSLCETITSHSGCEITADGNSNSNNSNRSKHYPSKVIGKSSSGLNRLMMSAEPITATKLISDLDNGDLIDVPRNNAATKVFAKKFVERYPSFDKSEAVKIWTFGCPPDAKANMIVDQTKGVQYLTEVRDSIISAFMAASESGVLCAEPMKGCRFNVLDCKIHSDPAHRGAGEIMPCARKCFYAAQIAAKPKLLEPIYLVDISVPTNEVNGVYKTLHVRRGEVDSFEESVGTPLCTIRAFVPVLETFGDKSQHRDGFTELLRKNTGGKGFVQMRFHHWNEVNGDPMRAGTPSHQLLMDVRKRKGMKLSLPQFSSYHDRK